MSFFQVENQGDHLLIKMNRSKANPINIEFIHQMQTLVREVNQNSAIRGVILTGQEHYFSAGVDVVELFGADVDAVRHFWSSLLELLADLLASPKAWVAAISGHSPAGGCVLTLCCDYRVMAQGDYKIGLNEVPVGIVVPVSILDLYASVIGTRLAYQYLLDGRLLSATEALSVGLVDEVVPMAQVVPQATLKLQQYLALNPVAWQATKCHLRQPLVQRLRDQSDLEDTLTHWWSPETRASLQVLIDRLKK